MIANKYFEHIWNKAVAVVFTLIFWFCSYPASRRSSLDIEMRNYFRYVYFNDVVLT
jgi:hypothetical protein